MNTSTFALAIFLLVPATGFAQAQTSSAPVNGVNGVPRPGLSQTEQGGRSSDATQVATTYRLGLEDEIRLHVQNDDLLNNQVYRVQSDGKITLPYLGSIMALGLTTVDLQNVISRLLVEKALIRNPQVSAEVSKYASQFVFVNGEIRMPGKVMMSGPMTLLTVLAMSGGTTPNAGTEIIVAHPKGQILGDKPLTDQDADIVKVNLTNLLLGIGDIPVRGNDIITVPKAETFYVEGHVKTQGVQIWEPGLTVEKAILKAGGVDERGKKGDYQVRRLVQGKIKELDIKGTDVVQPNDTIIVKPRLF